MRKNEKVKKRFSGFQDGVITGLQIGARGIFNLGRDCTAAFFYECHTILC